MFAFGTAVLFAGQLVMPEELVTALGVVAGEKKGRVVRYRVADPVAGSLLAHCTAAGPD
ncbi:hypothetical protein ACIQPR_41260 [Streptomyces sp. NPDC091280]|uniref:hypothetical protein n=1 Tax=Streptomyces sp. NPDC091280 TaxID=3365984 RepID=UPI0038291CDA